MAKAFTQKDRDNVYNQFISKLVSINLLDSELEAIKKLKVIMKIYKDTGMEFKGELELPHNGKIIYELYNDHRRQTHIDISKNINRPLAPFERKQYYEKIVDLFKKKNIWNSEDKKIIKLKKSLLEYKDNGTEMKCTLSLPSGEKLVLELYNNHLKENVIKILGERKESYDKIIDILKKKNLLEYADDEDINKLKENLLEYNNDGKEMCGSIALPDGSKLILELYKNTNKNIIKILEGSDPMTQEERKEVFDEIIASLKKDEFKQLTDQENDADNIKKLVKLCIDYKNNGTEHIGEFHLSKGPIKLVYELYKDHRKKSFIKITANTDANQPKNFYEESEGKDNNVDNDAPALVPL
jgi:hypothetical protein